MILYHHNLHKEKINKNGPIKFFVSDELIFRLHSPHLWFLVFYHRWGEGRLIKLKMSIFLMKDDLYNHIKIPPMYKCFNLHVYHHYVHKWNYDIMLDIFTLIVYFFLLLSYNHIEILSMRKMFYIIIIILCTDGILTQY